jgi:hypothetical protein
MTKRPRAFVTLSPEAMQAVAEIQRESRVPVSRGQVLQLLIRYGVEHYHQKLASARAACSREGIMSQMPDITITYQAGDSPPFLKANTGRGRLWLAQNIKGVRVTNTAMASPEELLSLIAKMTEVSAAWKK